MTTKRHAPKNPDPIPASVQMTTRTEIGLSMKRIREMIADQANPLTREDVALMARIFPDRWRAVEAALSESP